MTAAIIFIRQQHVPVTCEIGLLQWHTDLIVAGLLLGFLQEIPVSICLIQVHAVDLLTLQVFDMYDPGRSWMVFHTRVRANRLRLPTLCLSTQLSGLRSSVFDIRLKMRRLGTQ